MIPKISMSPSAVYKVQTAAYGRLLVGKALTDRRIKQLQKKGWFGNGILALARKEKVKRQRTIKVNLLDYI